MADKIKDFLKKKIRNDKFKKAGKGHKLNEQSSSSQAPNLGEQKPKRLESTMDAKIAGQAALARLEGAKSNTGKIDVSKAAMQARIKRELEQERAKLKQKSESTEISMNELEIIKKPIEKHLLAVSGVYFRCGLISDEILDRLTWYDRIEEFFSAQLAEDEAGLSACLIIHSCNENKDKIKACVDILTKYLDNIRNDPSEPKYWKIRMANKVFQEKVKPLRGTMEFLKAAGFEPRKMLNQEIEEEFLIWNPDNSDIDDLTTLIDALVSSESVELELDRNLQVLSPNVAAERSELPPDFFTQTTHEIAKEQADKTKSLELSQTLMTQAMREKLYAREIRKYQYTLIRVRFPDNNILQGTFAVTEKYQEVVNFVKENLSVDQSFNLKTATREVLMDSDFEKPLEELNLVPAVILTFKWNDTEDSKMTTQYLKDEVLSLLQSL